MSIVEVPIATVWREGRRSLRGTLGFFLGMAVAFLSVMHSPRLAIRRDTRRGFSPLKILFAISSISLLGIAATMWLPEICSCAKPPDAPVGTDVAALAATAEAFIVGHGTEGCPTPDQMQRDGFLSSRSNTADPWGTPYRIQCEPEHAVATSAGPDMVFDTEDDISSEQP